MAKRILCTRRISLASVESVMFHITDAIMEALLIAALCEVGLFLLSDFVLHEIWGIHISLIDDISVQIQTIRYLVG